MSAPTPAELDAAHLSETRSGEDSYGVAVGHLVMPNGSLIAVWQNDDALANALIREVARAVDGEEAPVTENYDPPAPPEPGEGSTFRAKEMKGRLVVLRPTGTGSDPTRPREDGSPWTWVTVDVWLIDRAGVDEHHTDVRISWWRVQEQLRQAGARFVAGRVVENDDRSVTVIPESDPAKRAVLDRVMPEIAAMFAAPPPAPEGDPGGIPPEPYEDEAPF